MHFHGPVIRPQTDADSLFIEVISGCTHNACRYCTYYKDAPLPSPPRRRSGRTFENSQATRSRFGGSGSRARTRFS